MQPVAEAITFAQSERGSIMSRTKRRNQNQIKNTTTTPPHNNNQNSLSTPNGALQLPAEIAQRLAYGEAVVANISDGAGQSTPVTAAQFGHYIKDHYTRFEHRWGKLFLEYQRQHVMADVMSKLKAGMDELSCEYLEQQDRMILRAYLGGNTLFPKDSLWTNEDRRIIELNRQKVEQGQPPFLKKVNLEWSSSYTNVYGMYDLPPAVLQRVNGKAIIDGGGFIGDTLVLFRDLFPQSVKYSFEPSQRNYDYMCNMLKTDIDNGSLKAFRQALGSHDGTFRLSIPNAGMYNSAASGYYDWEQQGRYEEVPMVTIDEVVAEHQLEVGLIKLDVEGVEPDIIQGALTTIKEQKPLLVIAFYHQPEEFYELKPFLESLNLGYKFRVRRSCISSPLGEFVLIAYQDD